MKNAVVALIAGMMFGVGLLVSGMTQPALVIGFLDVAGAWKPALALVMAGAILSHLPFALRTRSAVPPVARSGIDARLLIGASTFGIGWGLSGYCPGPALVSVVSLSPPTLVFVAAMAVGMMGARLASAR